MNIAAYEKNVRLWDNANKTPETCAFRRLFLHINMICCTLHASMVVCWLLAKPKCKQYEHQRKTPLPCVACEFMFMQLFSQLCWRRTRSALINLVLGGVCRSANAALLIYYYEDDTIFCPYVCICRCIKAGISYRVFRVTLIANCIQLCSLLIKWCWRLPVAQVAQWWIRFHLWPIYLLINTVNAHRWYQP